MSLGFPNSDMYGEYEDGGGESFWPSFTDIMMVIVMTFLLITVSVILNNWELVNSLKESVTAEKQANEKAQSALQVIQAKSVENETLDNRVVRLEALLRERTEKINKVSKENAIIASELESNGQLLIDTQAQVETLTNEKRIVAQQLTQLQQKLNEQDQIILNAQQEQQQSKESLVALESEKLVLEEALSTLKIQLSEENKNNNARTTQLEKLREQLQEKEESLQEVTSNLKEFKDKQSNDNQALISLQGQYKTLDQKYQKLLRPARSSKNKHIVKVVLDKVGNTQRYQLADQGQSFINVNSRQQLNRRLTRLKKKYGDNLYVKIIIPESSHISHSEAWRFTRDILKQYDYYDSDN